MKKEDSKLATSIAALIPAIPGWRAVLFLPHGEEADGMQAVVIVVKKVSYWALSAPSSASMGFFDIFGGDGGANIRPYDDENNRRFGDELHRLVPPSDKTDAQLVTEAKLWCAESIEKSKPTP